MSRVRIELPPKLVGVFSGEADYRGAYGGRGSAKTRSFAKMAAVRGFMWANAGISGVFVCGREFMNSLSDSSFSEVKAAILSEPWLAAAYDIGENYIRTRDGRISFAFIGLRRSLDSVKSTSRILILWVDEAEPVSEMAWSKAINTVREEGAEVWVTWNPEHQRSATHKRFRANPPSRSNIIELNWRDNPWFPSVLDRKRRDDKEKRPDTYEHVWEGAFVTVVEGAYFAGLLTTAKQKGHICSVNADPLLPLRAYADIGGAGAKSDAFVFWIVQFVDGDIRILDHYETQGQSIAFHVKWLRDNGYDEANVILPHDGAHPDATGKRYIDHFEDAGFKTRVIPNQGTGAAAQRIEAVRRLAPKFRFNAEKTEAGRQALGAYHERLDPKRSIGLGPEHDWASHSADAFGLMAIDYVEPSRSANFSREIEYQDMGYA